jgi:hypothetical protein
MCDVFAAADYDTKATPWAVAEHDLSPLDTSHVRSDPTSYAVSQSTGKTADIPKLLRGQVI